MSRLAQSSTRRLYDFLRAHPDKIFAEPELRPVIGGDPKRDINGQLHLLLDAGAAERAPLPEGYAERAGLDPRCRVGWRLGPQPYELKRRRRAENRIQEAETTRFTDAALQAHWPLHRRPADAPEPRGRKHITR